MIDAYLRELARALDAFGLRGAVARRLLAEARDHLEESALDVGEEQAVHAFGAPHDLAELAARELATTRTRSVAFATFSVLGLAGAAYAVVFATLPLAGSPDIAAGSVPGLGLSALLGIVFFPQLAFVTGCLAFLRAWRLRERPWLSAAELRVQQWRVAVAIGAGVLTFASLAVVAVDFRRDLAGWWVLSTVIVSGVACALLTPVAVAGVRSCLPVVTAAGPAESVFDDLDDVLRHVPGCRGVNLRREPRRLALVVALAAGAAVALAGATAGDPFDGLLRAVFEGVAVIGCYLVLGRRLGLSG
jgi:hypothetical protein